MDGNLNLKYENIHFRCTSLGYIAAKELTNMNGRPEHIFNLTFSSMSNRFQTDANLRVCLFNVSFL